jgi:uncharacterized protein
MMIRLTPQRREFFELYTQASANAVAIAASLVALLDRFPEGKDEALRDIKELEHEGDRLTLVTPFDRDDMYRLATAIDDVVDHIDEAADNLDMFKVQSIPERAKEQAHVIKRAAGKLDQAVQLLEGFKDSRRHLAELRRLEDEGDRLEREAVAELFRSGEDPLSIIRWKDIYGRLEEAVDACEFAADVLEAIVVKNR